MIRAPVLKPATQGDVSAGGIDVAHVDELVELALAARAARAHARAEALEPIADESWDRAAALADRDVAQAAEVAGSLPADETVGLHRRPRRAREPAVRPLRVGQGGDLLVLVSRIRLDRRGVLLDHDVGQRLYVVGDRSRRALPCQPVVARVEADRHRDVPSERDVLEGDRRQRLHRPGGHGKRLRVRRRAAVELRRHLVVGRHRRELCRCSRRAGWSR